MRSKIMAAVLALSTLVAVPALAHGKDDGASYPMAAAAFKQQVDAHQARAREHMEKRAAKLSADEAKEVRAKFDAGVAKINAEVTKATADGTVTKEEAQAIHKVAHELRGHHGKKHPKS